MFKKRKKILVADDEEDIRSMAVGSLEDLNADFFEAEEAAKKEIKVKF